MTNSSQPDRATLRGSKSAPSDLATPASDHNRFRADTIIGPRHRVREFIEGFDSAGGGWRNRLHALAILAILGAAMVQQPMTRWILAATAASILIIAGAAWIWRRARKLESSPKAN